MMNSALVLLCTLLGAAHVSADKFLVEFNVVVQSGDASFTVEVNEDWAPIGAARFKELVEKGFYDEVKFFRVMCAAPSHGFPNLCDCRTVAHRRCHVSA
jgi:hypothetical protein